MTEQLSLIPEKLVSPKARKVVLTELPEDLSGSPPDQGFIDSIQKYGFLQPIGLLEDGDTYQVALRSPSHPSSADAWADFNSIAHLPARVDTRVSFDPD